MSFASEEVSRADYAKLINKWSKFEFTETIFVIFRQLADPVKEQFFGTFDYVAAHTNNVDILNALPSLEHTADTLIYLTTTSFLVGLDYGAVSRLTGNIASPFTAYPEIATYLHFGCEPGEKIIVESVGRCVVAGMPMPDAKERASIITKALLVLSVQAFKVGYYYT